MRKIIYLVISLIILLLIVGGVFYFWWQRAGDSLCYLTGEENVHPEHKLPDHHIAALNISEHIDNELTLQQKIDAINNQSGYAILAHPNMPKHIYTVPELLSLTNYFGIEIFNGYCERKRGKGFAENKWDAVLTSGKKVWGFGVDDAHMDSWRGYGYSVGNFSDDESFKECLESGEFYASSGSKFTYISFYEPLKRITVKTDKTSWIKFFGKNGTEYYSYYGQGKSYYIQGDEQYIRVRIANADGRAWTQPFWIEENGSVTQPYDVADLPTNKFNTHCHGVFDTTYDWYLNHGYKGIIITNYNRITDLEVKRN